MKLCHNVIHSFAAAPKINGFAPALLLRQHFNDSSALTL